MSRIIPTQSASEGGFCRPRLRFGLVSISPASGIFLIVAAILGTACNTAQRPGA